MTSEEYEIKRLEIINLRAQDLRDLHDEYHKNCIHEFTTKIYYPMRDIVKVEKTCNKCSKVLDNWNTDYRGQIITNED